MNTRTRTILVVVVALVAAVVVGLALVARRHQTTTAGNADAGAEGDETSTGGPLAESTKPYDTKEPLDVAQPKTRAAAVIVDVLTPQAVRTVLFENAWLGKAGQAPLGRGFLGAWAAFLGSQKTDVGMLGAGLVRDAVIDAFAANPLRLVLFEGEPAMPPAMVVEKPPEQTSLAVATLTKALQRGGYTVDACPGETTYEDADGGVPPAVDASKAVDGGVPPTPVAKSKARFEIVRWLVAERELYVAQARDRVVVAKSARSVVHAVCTSLPELKKPAGVDVAVSPQLEELGRPAQVLGQLLGLQDDLALEWKVDGTRLVPVGIAGTVAKGDRIDAAAVPESMLKAVPAQMPVMLATSVRLPATLDAQALLAAWSGKGDDGALKTRTVVAVWEPRGDAKAPMDVAILWSEPGDLDGLKKIFAGKNAMSVDTVCGNVVLASTTALLSKVKAACKGSSPSLLFAEPSVVAGLKQPQSVTLLVDGGGVLARLLEDGWAKEREESGEKPEKTKERATPQEIDDAKKLLLELPRQGLVGTKNGAQLAPRGFST